MGVRISLINVRIFITESALVAALIITIILELASTLKRLDNDHERKVALSHAPATFCSDRALYCLTAINSSTHSRA
jgi:hypothetical protein